MRRTRERKRGPVGEALRVNCFGLGGRGPGFPRTPKNAVASAGVLSFAPATFLMRHCIYPGTFDPITCGHLDVLSRAARLFSKVTVAVAESAGKAPLFSSDQRVEMIQANLGTMPHVSVTTFGGLLVEFCMAQKADAIIRGLRALSDFEFEFNMALMNRHLEPKLETLFVMPNEQFSYTSSTLVKQVAKFGGDVRHFVPPNVADALKAAFAPVRV
jgi:pantetheine-phosphate adenylyltransferase